MMKRWFMVLSLPLCCILLFTGCWDLKELNDISVITGMAIDKGKDHPIKLTIEAVIASELNPKTAGKTAPAVTLSLEGDTVADLVRKVNVGFSKRPEYSHMKIFVISEDIARQGMAGFLDFVDRNREIRNDFNVLIAHKVNAADVLKVTYPDQKVSTMKLSPQLENMVKDFGGDPNVRMMDVLSDILSKGKEPVMASVTVEGDKKKGSSSDNMKEVDLPAMVKLTGMGVFKENKLIGFVPIEDVRNMMWVQDKIKHTSIEMPCGQSSRFSLSNTKNPKVTIRIPSSHTDLKVRYENGKPHFFIRVSCVARLEGTQCSDDINDLKTYIRFDQLAEQYIEKQIKGTIQKIQKDYGSDIFGFGEELYHEHPKQYEQVEDRWNEEFAKAEVEVHATVTVQRPGLKINTVQDMPRENGTKK